VVTDAILNWFFDLIESMVSGLPGTDSPMSTFNFSMINDMNYFLPISEMFGLFIIFFALGGPFIASSLIIWFFVGILRGGSTKA
jgi:hypothetical protein